MAAQRSRADVVADSGELGNYRFRDADFERDLAVRGAVLDAEAREFQR